MVVVGSHTALVVKGAHKRSIPLPTATHVTAVGAIDRDGRRWLLGDNQGGLHLLLLRASPEGDVGELQLQRLGEVRFGLSEQKPRGHAWLKASPHDLWPYCHS